ncbi:MAG: ATP-binding protein [Candidatus Hadarchaeales archaeon]
MEKQEIIPRDILTKFEKLLERREALAIKGPRQSGKTTLLKILARRLENAGKVVFLNFEDPDVLEAFERDPKGYVRSFMLGPERHYFLMDEFHYISEPGKKLKLLYDTFENAKFIVTGSSSLELGGAMAKFLVGRVFFFELLPFSFHEFLVAKNERLAKIYEKKNEAIKAFMLGEEVELEEDIFVKELEPLFLEYLTYGGYPAVVLANDAETKRMILKGIYDTYISKDVIEFLKFTDASKYRDTIRILAASVGGLLNYQAVGSAVQSYFKELKRILSILSETYVIILLRPFSRNPRTELRKSPKVYFFDLGLRNYVLNNFNPLDRRADAGAMVENFVLLELMRAFPAESLNYWRTIAKAEVDFVLRVGEKLIPIEAKYQSFAEPKISRSLRSFIHTYSPERALVVTRDRWARSEIDGTKVLFAPAGYI